MSSDSVAETIQALMEAGAMLNPPAGRNEPLGHALKRSPEGHPMREVMGRTVKCIDCGGLAPISQISFAYEEAVEGGSSKLIEPVCPYCGSINVDMWKPPVAGHA